MLNKSIGILINNCENRYKLVLGIAKSARRISKKAQDDKIILEEKPVTLAMNEMAAKVENKD